MGQPASWLEWLLQGSRPAQVRPGWWEQQGPVVRPEAVMSPNLPQAHTAHSTELVGCGPPRPVIDPTLNEGPVPIWSAID